MTRCALLVIAVALGVGGPALAEPTTYTIDAAKSEVVVRVYKAGIASGLAHDHVIAAKDFAGELTHDPKDLAACRVRVVAQAASLVADEPALVKKYGLPSGPSASDRKKIEETLKGEEQLNVKKHPTISFTGTQLTQGEEGLRLAGKLTLRGVTKDVAFPVTLVASEDGATLRGKGELRIKQSDFGYEPYSAFLGSVKVKDSALIVVDLLARKAATRNNKTPKKER